MLQIGEPGEIGDGNTSWTKVLGRGLSHFFSVFCIDLVSNPWKKKLV